MATGAEPKPVSDRSLQDGLPAGGPTSEAGGGRVELPAGIIRDHMEMGRIEIMRSPR
jgi:hypothetical protein